MTFPSKDYIALCTNPEPAEKLREEWEKRGAQEGDWVRVEGHD